MNLSKSGLLHAVFKNVAPLALLAAPLSAQAQQLYCLNESSSVDDDPTTEEDYTSASLQAGTSLFLNACGLGDGPLCGQNRLLNGSETAFLKSFFGDQVNTSIIRLYYTGRDNDLIGIAPSGESLLLYGPDMALADYAFNPFNANDLRRFRTDKIYREAVRTFFHEIGHIWQNQHNDMHTRDLPLRALSDAFDAPDCDKYAYRVLTNVPQISFSMYSIEQQATMIEDYLTFVYAGREYFGDRFRNHDDEGAPEAMVDIIERQFPSAKVMRLSFEANRPLMDAQIAALPPAINIVSVDMVPATPPENDKGFHSPQTPPMGAGATVYRR